MSAVSREAAAPEGDHPGSGALESFPMGEGFVVWESSRSGAWRIWISDLDGGEPRQLTPDERRIHCCPHVSPDGEWIAYLSLEADQRGYPGGGGLGRLRRIRPDGSDQEDLVTQARTYYENRAAVWRGSGQLIYIDRERETRLLDLESGENRRLLPAAELRGLLVDAALRYAASGLQGFHGYDAIAGRLVERTPFGGCQFYFSQDGRWGFWMAGAGGPLRRIELATGEVTTWLRKNDSRLPEGLGYMYFPMLSANRRLLMLAASNGEHDHFRANYELFAFEVDPDTLEILGNARRIAPHEAPDRFPDAWLAPLPLGRISGEAPLVARLEAPATGTGWSWRFGDGTGGSGPMVEHRFARPGRFEVTATPESGSESLRGLVVVRPGEAPRVVRVDLAGGRGLEVVFDEPVSIEHARFALESEAGIRGFSLSAEGRRVHVRLDRELRGADRLWIAGVEDLSDPPHRMAGERVEVPSPSWPSARRGLLFLWKTGESANLVADPAGGAERSVVLTAHGSAHLDHVFAMRPAGGHFAAPVELAAHLRRGAQATNELSMEVVLGLPAGGGNGSIVELGHGGRRLLRLRQEGDRLLFGILDRKWNEPLPEVELVRGLGAGGKRHLAVTYSAGLLRAFLDGERLEVPEGSSSGISGDFFHWRDTELRFGDGSEWRGAIEGVAFYDRLLEAEEVRENARRYARLVAERPAVERWVVRARRAECSPAPSLASITPYREALRVCRYEVLEVLEAAAPEAIGPLVEAVRWGILDGQEVPLPPGGARRVAFERYADNRQLESLFVEDTLGGEPGRELFYVVSSDPL